MSQPSRLHHLSELPPLLRVLLTQDGTVTRTLEAWFWERMIVTAQEQHTLADGPERYQRGELAFDPGTDALMRRAVTICGSESGRLYCQALSFLRLDALPHGLAESLLAGQIGIGELLRHRGLETYRELLETRTDALHEASRRYLICAHQQPLIQVTEVFPLAPYRGHS